MWRRMLMRWSLTLLSLIAIFDRLAPIICRHVSCPPAPWLNDAVRRLIELKRHALLRYRWSQSPADWQRYRVCRTTWICCSSSEKFPPLQLIPRSNSIEIFVPLAMHNLPLLLYFCTLETLFSWIIFSWFSIFLILSFWFSLIPFFLTFFLPLLTFPRPHLLSPKLPCH